MRKRGAAAEDMRSQDETDAEEVTEKRLKSEVQAFAPCMIPTKWIRAVKPELLAIARGDVDTEPPPAAPSDPYGGLIPVLDEDEHVEAIDQDWYLVEGGARPESVPRLQLRHDELIGLPIDHRHGFLLCQIDGVRTVADLCDLCSLQMPDAITMIDELVALSAITIR